MSGTRYPSPIYRYICVASTAQNNIRCHRPRSERQGRCESKGRQSRETGPKVATNRGVVAGQSTEQNGLGREDGS